MAPRGKQAAPGDNSADMTENEEMALFFKHARKRMAIDAKIKILKDERKDAGKVAQIDGIKLKSLDYAIEALTADDKRKVSDRFHEHGKILGWLGYLPEGTQLDLLKDRLPAMEKIKMAGRSAGLLGTDRVSGFQPASNEDNEWLAGYDEGQAIVRDNLKSAMEKANAKSKAGTTELLRTNKADSQPGKEKQDDADLAPPAGHHWEGEGETRVAVKDEPPRPRGKKATAIAGEKTNAEKAAETASETAAKQSKPMFN